jgi:hypothetical protein
MSEQREAVRDAIRLYLDQLGDRVPITTLDRDAMVWRAAWRAFEAAGGDRNTDTVRIGAVFDQIEKHAKPSLTLVPDPDDEPAYPEGWGAP